MLFIRPITFVILFLALVGEGRAQSADIWEQTMAALKSFGVNVDRSCAMGFGMRVGVGLPEYVRGIRSADDPKLMEIRRHCPTLQPYEQSLSKPEEGQLTVTRLVDWMRSSVFSQSDLRSAFGRCQEIVGEYQKALLIRISLSAQSTMSRAEQQALERRVITLKESRELATKVACLKKALADLRFAGEPGNSYVDHLSILNGSLGVTRDDLALKARTAFNDLTPAGLKNLAAGMSLSNLDTRVLASEINRAIEAQYPDAGGHLACLLPNDWVSWFSSAMSCHGPALESALTRAAASL